MHFPTTIVGLTAIIALALAAPSPKLSIKVSSISSAIRKFPRLSPIQEIINGLRACSMHQQGRLPRHMLGLLTVRSYLPFPAKSSSKGEYERVSALVIYCDAKEESLSL
ncbi:hypothetical protein DL95DRAFT_494265 [Leptodontidium sp. 2 PMI_412]|nr:hypothetical protein DL95DRAFT_494265 [Leptodontidium sp. 2 PMI_412]